MIVTATSTRVSTLADLEPLVGRPLGTSEWLQIAQPRINTFADATEDHQWIHTDPDRAASSGPFGGPIAHGYLTLSLIIPMWSQVLEVDSVTMTVNYGLNRVRFTAPVPADAQVRLNATLKTFEWLPKGGAQVSIEAVIELDGSERPAVVAEPIYRLYE